MIIKISWRLIKILLPRIFITSIILLFIRSGTFLPVPGINHNDLAFSIQQNLVAKNLIRTFLGDKIFIIGLFTLNIFPAINATIILQFLIGFSPQLAKLQKEGDFQGRREISRLTRNITVILAIVQSIGVTLYLRPILFDWNVLLASQIVIWLTAGAMIVLWLSEVITDYGLGNGTSLLVYTNIVSNLPNLISKIATDNTENTMVLSAMSMFGLGILILGALYAIVLLQNSTLNINLISSKRLSRASAQYDGNDSISYLPLRFNQAGVMPIILTTSFLVIPNYLINLGIFQSLNFLINFKWIYWIGYFVLILAFSSFYSSIVLNPKDISDQLQKSAVKIPGVRPGVQTIFYLKQEIQRITLMGATLLAFITIIPNFIESTLNITSLNGLSTTSFLILGGVVLDLKREVSNIYFSEIYTDMYR
uniref:SecY-type transporter protein n=1 Tax=Pseudo-nitzschia delicatissima TaxID=44447 RepID=UPI001D115B4D|nr:SecY-type transporter protein [Pseudo-nitzschia delicatissima]UBA14766.1 SecY-type transporter protein [Pseudo-nitzschia delicatissima]